MKAAGRRSADVGTKYGTQLLLPPITVLDSNVQTSTIPSVSH